MKALRFKKGLVYGVSSGTGSSFDRGRFGIDTSFLRSNMSETVESICEEVRKLKTSGVPESEFQLARNKILKSSRRAMQTSGSWVDEHVQKALFYPDLKRTIIDYLQDVEAVTIDDLNRVANKYLTQDNWYLSATGNVTEADIPELTSLISL
jgi:predicted Zn-dependent peptidase